MPPRQKNNTKQSTKAKKRMLTKNTTASTKKTAASPSENSSGTTMAGKKRRQANSSEGSCVKQQKTCPLTAVDIPDIVMAVVQALPSRTDTPRLAQDQTTERRGTITMKSLMKWIPHAAAQTKWQHHATEEPQNHRTVLTRTVKMKILVS